MHEYVCCWDVFKAQQPLSHIAPLCGAANCKSKKYLNGTFFVLSAAFSMLLKLPNLNPAGSAAAWKVMESLTSTHGHSLIPNQTVGSLFFFAPVFLDVQPSRFR